MTLVAVTMSVVMWAVEGKHMITSATVTLMVVMLAVSVLMDSAVLFGPEN